MIEDGAEIGPSKIFEQLAEIAVDHGVANTAKSRDQFMQRQESNAITVDEHLIGIVCS